MNCSALYRIAEEEAERQATLPGYHDDTFAAGAVWGAMAVFALIGMAEAIRQTDDYRREHTCYWCKLVDHGGARRCPKAPECPF